MAANKGDPLKSGYVYTSLTDGQFNSTTAQEDAEERQRIAAAAGRNWNNNGSESAADPYAFSRAGFASTDQLPKDPVNDTAFWLTRNRTNFVGTDKYFSSNALGIDQTRPLILYVADFVPVYDNANTGNFVLSSLSVKENANLTAARNAITFLAGSETTRNTLTQNNLRAIQSTTNLQKDLVQNFFLRMYQLSKLFYPVSYTKNIEVAAIGNFTNEVVPYSFLRLLGISETDAKKMSGAKFWQKLMFHYRTMCESYHSNFLSGDAVIDDSKIDYNEYNPQQPNKIWYNNTFAESIANDSSMLSIASAIRNNTFRNVNTAATYGMKILDDVSPEKAIAYLACLVGKEEKYSDFISKMGWMSLIGDKTILPDVALTDGIEAPQRSLWRRYIGERYSTDTRLDAYRVLGNQENLPEIPLSQFPYFYTVENDNVYDIRTFEQEFNDEDPATPGHVYFMDTKGTFVPGASTVPQASRGNILKLHNKLLKHKATITTMMNMLNADSILKVFNDAFDTTKSENEFVATVKRNYRIKSLRAIRLANKKSFNFSSFATEKDINSYEGPQVSEFSRALVKGCITANSFFSDRKNRMKDALFAAVYQEATGNVDKTTVMTTSGGGGITNMTGAEDLRFVRSTASWGSSYYEHQLVVQKYYLDFLKVAFESVDSASKRKLIIDDMKNKANASKYSLDDKSISIDVMYIDFYTGNKTRAVESIDSALVTGTDRTVYSGRKNDALELYRVLKDSKIIKTIVSLMTARIEQFKKNSTNLNKSHYSQSDIRLLAYSYFEFLLRVFDLISFENVKRFEVLRQTKDGKAIYDVVQAIVEYDFAKLETRYENFFDLGYTIRTQDTLQYREAQNITYDKWESSLLLDFDSYVNGDQAGFFDESVDVGEKNRTIVPRVIKANKILKSCYQLCAKEIKKFNDYNQTIMSYIDEFIVEETNLRNFLAQDFSVYISKVQGAIQEKDANLSEEKKELIRDNAVIPEQLLLNSYIGSEALDKLNDQDTFSKLKANTSAFFGINSAINWTAFLPKRDLELISFSCLHSFFKNQKFIKQKAFNAKIIGVGFPNKLIRRIKERKNRTKQLVSDDIFIVKIYKINRLYPEIVHKPLTFRVQTNRFPTRVLANWDFNTLKDTTYNLSEIPTKVVLNTGEVLKHTNMSQSDSYFISKGAFNSQTSEHQSIRREVYENQATSFLLGEYLRWFTGMNFDEERYYHYNTFEQVPVDRLDQRLLITQNERTTSTNNSNVMVYEVDGVKYYVPIANTGSTNRQLTSTSPTVGVGAVNITGIANTNTNIINITNELNNYLVHDTFLKGFWEHTRQIYYPKKFDRVFNFLVDPDDFYIDTTKPSLSPNGTILTSYINNQLVIKVGNEYKMKDLTEEDIGFDEYFATIESYNSLNNI